MTNAVTAPPTSSWSTPKKLRLFMALAWALAALLFFSGELRLDGARHAVKTIGKDAAPSIIAAQDIGLSLAELDANVANALLGSPAHRAIANEVVEKQRVSLTKSVVEAAENITYGDAEKAPILALVTNLGRYLEVSTEARVLFERSKDVGPPNDKDAKASLAVYFRATDLLHDQLLKSADELDAANRAYLDHAYREERGATGVSTMLALLLGGGLLATLIYTQLFLFRRMRRMFSPALLVASLLTVGYTAYLVTRFAGAEHNLKVATEDAFDSVHTLVKARTWAYDANGDESRWLLDQSPQRGFEDAFKKKVAILTSAPLSKPPASKKDVKFTGLFADELRNVTFEGEHAAAVEMLQAFMIYYAIDLEIRRLFRAGKRDAAVELCIGDRPDQSNAAFYRFDQAISKVIEINRTQFEHTIDAEASALKSAEIVAPFFALAIALLVFLGLRARLREYRA